MATAERAPDIVSAIEDQALPTLVLADEARRAGRHGIVLLVDHQIGLMLGMRDAASLSELKSNGLGLARTAKALGIPILLASSNAQWQNGDNLPELKALFPEQPVYRRTMLEPFLQDLPEYGFAIQNFWNNANGHTVPDPFGMVK